MKNQIRTYEINIDAIQNIGVLKRNYYFILNSMQNYILKNKCKNIK